MIFFVYKKYHISNLQTFFDHNIQMIFKTFSVLQIFLKIKDADSEDEELKKAKHLITRIFKRDFYQSLSTINITKDHPLRNKNYKDLESELQELVKKEANLVKPEDILVIQSKVTMGMGSRNPIHNVTFYNKQDQIVQNVNSLNIAEYLPDFLNFITWNIVCKSDDKLALKEAAHLISKLLPQNEPKETNGTNGH